ncbi:MAG: DNA helicase-2/ATP-dependent DNA helicase PcrA [Nonlabens sp.]|jgi:DNA helicase-2/ATP-dependent DNA helicase PcrA
MSKHGKNELIIAAAGAGKTSYIIALALADPSKKILITTYTRSNASEIRERLIVENKRQTGIGSVPKNILIEEWFTFLLKHGVRPFKVAADNGLKYVSIGFNLSENRSGVKRRYKNIEGEEVVIYWGEDENVQRYYFTKSYKIYSDKISKFVLKCEDLTQGGFTERINNNYDHIFIDEVQDLAGWDLEVIKLLFRSDSEILLVGDPRQTVYLTNHSSKNDKYKDGKIDLYVKDNCSKLEVNIDFETLNKTHRNKEEIASFASKLYPEYPETEVCSCDEHRGSKVEKEGVYLIRPSDIERCLSEVPSDSFKTIRFRNSIPPEINVGVSKGKTYQRVLIYPTVKIISWIKGNDQLAQSTRAKFYVALTRSVHSSFIVYDYKDDEEFMDGIKLFDAVRLQAKLPF